MRSPGFWWGRPGWASALLEPAALVYGAVAGRRMRRAGHRAHLPVICVGNFTVGGSGKTPTAIAVGALLREAGRSPAFLLRGYGGRLAGPLVVDPAVHGADAVGDEALLLARHGPTVVSRDRPAGAALAAETGADVIVMDDGLQNPSIRKDLAFAVFDGEAGLGNGRVLPAGPLRAPVEAQWPRVDAVIVVGAGSAGEAAAEAARSRGLPALEAVVEPAPDAAAALAGRRVLAFAGIGRPEKFFRTCRAAGLDPVTTRAFPDHHPFEAGEIARLLDEAEHAGLVPVTTEKDLVRLDRLRAAEPRLALVRVLPIALRFREVEAVRSLLAARIPVP